MYTSASLERKGKYKRLQVRVDVYRAHLTVSSVEMHPLPERRSGKKDRPVLHVKTDRSPSNWEAISSDFLLRRYLFIVQGVSPDCVINQCLFPGDCWKRATNELIKIQLIFALHAIKRFCNVLKSEDKIRFAPSP